MEALRVYSSPRLELFANINFLFGILNATSEIFFEIGLLDSLVYLLDCFFIVDYLILLKFAFI